MKVNAYGAYAGDKPLEPLQITRRFPGANDVQIDIAYCGICHSDLHQVRAEWAGTRFPCVPGHEIVGQISAVGAHVTGFKTDDLVGIGCIVDSCKHCEECDSGFENYCDGMIGTYNFPTLDEPGWTLGGYSQKIVVHERYVRRTCHPEEQLAAVAPLLKRDGTLTPVGAQATPHPSPEVFNLILKRRSLAGSMIGGIPETQEMLDFCAEHGIVSDIELIRADEINGAKQISPRPVLLIHGEKAHSRYFSETAYVAAAEPKELVIIPGANHTDLYDHVDVIPFDKLTAFFRAHLK